MLSLFDFAREMTTLSVTVRMVAAFLCGGLIGLEREFKRRTAGFRTHILISLGACIAILTNLYLYQAMHLYTDISRLGAQVVAGIGFIGAGTIVVTKRRRVKGLTTAAGLWTAAIIGLACGAGFLECAMLATAMVLLAELLLVRLEYALNTKADDARFYTEYGKAETMEEILRLLRGRSIAVSDLEITRSPGEDGSPRFCAMLSVRGIRKKLDEDLMQSLNELDDVVQVEEI